MDPKAELKKTCFHCGEDCLASTVLLIEKTFCCEGCKMVYEILTESNLCHYYSVDPTPISPVKNVIRSDKYSFIDKPEYRDKLIDFTDGKETHIHFRLPQIHCSSCIWILENFHKLDPGVRFSKVNFTKKEIHLVFTDNETSLRAIVEKLARIGYEPSLHLSDLQTQSKTTSNQQTYLKIGIAGFCFSNIMMLSFPHYFSGGFLEVVGLNRFLNYINLTLSLPVLFYCSTDFFMSAYKGLRQKQVNMDAPIALALLITFSRSIYEIISNSGPGYLDSMTGIVFFMLLGRTFQNRVYQTITFDRNYTSYFPVSVQLKTVPPRSVPVSEIKPGDRMLIHNNELIPADAVLVQGAGYIDYSFISGETLPIAKIIGDLIYAGGKHIGPTIELSALKAVSQSYLTELWNNSVFHKEKKKKTTQVQPLSFYFSIAVFFISIVTGLYWLPTDVARAMNAATAVLIVACPCALLLSSSFTNGHVLRIFGRNNFYLKNAEVLEAIVKADTLIFDKTGTITDNGLYKVHFHGENLNSDEREMTANLVGQSLHPLSRAIFNHLEPTQKFPVHALFEQAAAGIAAEIKGHHLKMGTASFIGHPERIHSGKGSTVFLSIDNVYKGFFSIANAYRKGFQQLVNALKKKFNIELLSGDNASETAALAVFFDKKNMLFNQTAQNKLDRIQYLQSKGKTVMMIGDGLNDAGALKASDIGIAVTEDVNTFTPECDAILEGASLDLLGKFIDFAKAGRKVVVASFLLSITYNIIGIYYSIQGTLQPVIAAILMPASTITIILFTMSATSLIARVNKL